MGFNDLSVRAAAVARLAAVLAASGLLALAAQAAQAAAAAQQTAAPASGTVLEEIIITARRRSENLQNVPSTVTAVTAGDVEKLNILRFEDIDKVVAGIQLQGSGTFNASSSARGVTFQVASAAFTPTVAQYVNDAPVLTAENFQSVFDIGQIEVLRGPQGTLRGVSAPSGAMTFTTRRPDLDRFSADVNTSVTNLHGRNFQAAASFPLVADKLAVRLAALRDENDSGGVRSVNSPIRPSSVSDGVRVSLRFEPTRNFAANVMFQRLYRTDIGFGGNLFGTGAPGGIVPGSAPPLAAPPANYNGPPLGIYDRLTVGENPSVNHTAINMWTANLEWSFAGQQLSYVGSKQKLHLDGRGAGDGTNMIPGYDPYGRCCGPDDVDTHELRLSSVDRLWGTMDYVVGAFNQFDHVDTNVDNGVASYLAGSFGAPGTVLTPKPPNERYVLHTLIVSPRTTNELSYFANVTFHVGPKLEIGGGARYISSKVHRITDIKTSPAYIALALPAGTCAAIGGQFGVTYPGICDRLAGGGQAVPYSDVHLEHKPTTYDASVAYHFSPDLMVYGHAGSSWREGPYTVGINNALNDADLNKLTFIDPEKSESVEVGLKWSFLDRRGRLNVDYYQQTYKGLIYSSPFGVYYLSYSTATGAPAVATYNFNSNADAKVKGFDVEAAFELSKNWSLSGNFSWADGKLSNASIPCNDGNFDGTSDTIVPTVAGFLAAGKKVTYCTSSASTSTAPKWNVNLQSEYAQPLTDRTSGFIRGLYSYVPENPNASQVFVTPAYGLLNLYVGLRDPKRQWEVALFAKNALDTQKILSQGANELLAPAGLATLFGRTGYSSVSLTPRREIGVNVRYAFDGAH
jgi:iron complex outermembrane recepter protein